MDNEIMPKKIELSVHLAFDDEAKVWYVASSDIPGLSLEADSPDALISRILLCADEMVDLNIEEIIENIATKDTQKSKQSASKARPELSVRPVFDSPFDLAYA